MDRYTGLTSVGETGNDNEQQPSKQLEDSMSSDGGGKLRAAGTASHHGALEESSKGSGSEQDDASSEMHGDEYGEEDSTVGVGVAEQQAAGPSHPVVMPGDRLAVLKKQKRLAMNRESARNRRKRKKILLETLQKQNDELTRTNRTLLLSKAALASKIQTLEQELSIARTTIAQYQMGGGSTSVVAGMPTHGGVGLGQSLPGTQNIQRGDALDQQLRSQTTDPLGTSDNLSRLMQAQLEHLALQRQQANALDPTGSASFHQQAGLGTTGFPFHRHLSQPAFTNEALLRRHGLELKALSQAARDSALGSLMSRQQTNDVFNQQDREASERSLASSGLSQSTGMRADIDQLLSQQLNPVMLDQRGGLQGSAGPASSQANAGLRLPDTRLHQLETSQDDIAANRQQKILRELLRQRHSGGSWDNKPPPDDRPDPSL